MKTPILIIAALLLAAASVVAGPQVKIPEPVFNFGKVPQNATVTHRFWLYSAGTDTLRITKVVPGCGCTKAPLADSVLAPGDSTVLEIAFATGRYGGYVTKKPYIETNMGEEKTMLEINTHVLNFPDSALPLIITPARVDVSQFSATPRRKTSFTIQNMSQKDYALTLVDYPADYFAVKLPGAIKAGETVTAEIEVTEAKVPEEFEKSFTFQVNDDKSSRYSVPIKRMYRLKDRAETEE